MVRPGRPGWRWAPPSGPPAYSAAWAVRSVYGLAQLLRRRARLGPIGSWRRGGNAGSDLPLLPVAVTGDPLLTYHSGALPTGSVRARVRRNARRPFAALRVAQSEAGPGECRHRSPRWPVLSWLLCCSASHCATPARRSGALLAPFASLVIAYLFLLDRVAIRIVGAALLFEGSRALGPGCGRGWSSMGLGRHAPAWIRIGGAGADHLLLAVTWRRLHRLAHQMPTLLAASAAPNTTPSRKRGCTTPW